ncbi:MAG: integrase DNA-binding domain-containing protein, partial [Spirochaetales bacterium]|nr:integrase DNA-binding domain-containing protein [Candidatus Physcosoma equi]
MQQRRDSRHRVLRRGESLRPDGKYQFKYLVNGKPKFVYSWRLEPTDPLPRGKKPCKALRELEKEIGRDIESQMDFDGRNLTVLTLVERYLKTKTGVRPNTRRNYSFVLNILKKEEFAQRTIKRIKVSDAKLFLIKLQQDGRGYSTVKTIRGVLRPAFQMAVDDDILVKNPFQFELVGVVVNDSVTREAISREDMRRFLKFVHDDNVYCKYYEVVYILFHTGLRISEFCGLTIRDIDFENNVIVIDHQLQRVGMTLHIEKTKTSSGTRKIPMTKDVADNFRAIIEDREVRVQEKMVDGYCGFLFVDDAG